MGFCNAARNYSWSLTRVVASRAWTVVTNSRTSEEYQYILIANTTKMFATVS